MEPGSSWMFIVLVILLMMSAFFSASETALTSLSKIRLKNMVEDKIKNEKCNAAAALEEVANTFVAMFESMGDEYFRERAADIKDVSRRLLANL